MEDEIKNEVSPVSSLTNDTNELTTKIIEAKDVEEIKQLTQLFNINQTKKEAVRLNKLNLILDEINDKILDRLQSEDEIKDENLIKYSTAINQSIARSSDKLTNVNTIPLVQINQNNINIENSDLSRESREKILETVRKFMEMSNKDVIDVTDENSVYYTNEGEDN